MLKWKVKVSDIVFLPLRVGSLLALDLVHACISIEINAQEEDCKRETCPMNLVIDVWVCIATSFYF